MIRITKDPDHKQKVNDLIPWAVNHANERVKKTGDIKKYRDEWSTCYLAKMNQMAISDGLRIEISQPGITT